MPPDTPLRIGVYVPSLMGGGAERVAAVLASGFRAAGHDASLMVDLADGANAAFLDPGVPVVRLGPGHAGSVLALARALARDRFDAILAVGGAADVKLMAAKALAFSGVPAVLSYHGRSDVGRGRLGGLAFTLAPLLTRRAARTICVSGALVRHLVEDWRADPRRVCAIPNPIPVERARPARDEAELLGRPATVVAVGRLVPEKDLATLVRAVARLGDGVGLTLLGEGPERNALTALAARLGVGHRVSLPGYAAEPWAAYAGARVFALSSRSEGFGNVVVEALASGLPVVSTDCGGPREILGGGRWGAIVPVGDDAALAAALRGALARPGDPATRVERARRYRTDAVVAEYVALFRAVARA